MKHFNIIFLLFTSLIFCFQLIGKTEIYESEAFQTVSNYAPPYGTYKCIDSDFPGIYPGTVAFWDSDGWTVNGVTYPGGIAGHYRKTSNGFVWTNGENTVRWKRVYDD